MSDPVRIKSSPETDAPERRKTIFGNANPVDVSAVVARPSAFDDVSGRRELSDRDIADTMLSLVARCGEGRSICPSEVPRQLLGETGPWRQWLKRTRVIAGRLSDEGKIDIVRKGKVVSSAQMRGVVRLRLPCTAPPDAGCSSVQAQEQDPPRAGRSRSAASQGADETNRDASKH